MILRLCVIAALIACCNLVAAASDVSAAPAADTSSTTDVLAQLAAMVAQNAAMTRKLETLEARLDSGSVLAARSSSATRDTAAAQAPRAEHPALTIEPALGSTFSHSDTDTGLAGTSAAAAASLGATSTAVPAWKSYPPLLRVDNSEMRLSEAASQRLHRLRDTTPGYGARSAEALVAWLRSLPGGGGGFVGPARIEPMPSSSTQTPLCEDCRLVRATRDLSPGEAIVSIPRSALFDAATAYASEWTNTRRAVLQHWPHLEPQGIWIAVALLYDYARMPAFRDGVAVDYGAEPSPFAPFYATLPLDFSSHPSLFDMSPESNEDPHFWLRGSPTLNSLRMHVVALDDEAHDLVEALRDKGLGVLFKQSHYVWAKLVVLTRAFAVNTTTNPLRPSPLAPDRTLLTLAPFADMLNHAPNPDALWEFDERSQQFRMSYTPARGAAPLKAGEALSTTYGSHRSNRHLFTTYGFVVEEGTVNDDMVVSLRVPRPETRGSRAEEQEEALSLWRQRVALLQLLHPEGWVNSTDINALVLSPSERRSSGLAAESYNVFRCLFSARELFGKCFSFARIAVASPAELLALFTTHLPACPTISFEQSTISWGNEIRAVKLLAEAAQEAMEAYAQVAFDAHEVQDERERLRMHQRAMAEGLCDPDVVPVAVGESKRAGAQRRQSLGCLTFNQRNMLLLRACEKDLLSMFLAIGRAVTRFLQDPPASWIESQRWLATHAHPSENRTAAYVYLDQLLLPLWNRKQGWSAPAEAKGA